MVGLASVGPNGRVGSDGRDIKVERIIEMAREYPNGRVGSSRRDMAYYTTMRTRTGTVQVCLTSAALLACPLQLLLLPPSCSSASCFRVWPRAFGATAPLPSVGISPATLSTSPLPLVAFSDAPRAAVRRRDPETPPRSEQKLPVL